MEVWIWTERTTVSTFLSHHCSLEKKKQTKTCFWSFTKSVPAHGAKSTEDWITKKGTTVQIVISKRVSCRAFPKYLQQVIIAEGGHIEYFLDNWKHQYMFYLFFFFWFDSYYFIYIVSIWTTTFISVNFMKFGQPHWCLKSV